MTIPKLRVINGGKRHTCQPHIISQNLNVSDNRRIPAGAIVNTQAAANCLPFTRSKINSRE
ncbi:hypothetical protein DSM106972_023810 [Dulcicalothrix desertica PCC 7102]|uniref:Uncharacterized protein n=1 Tax=Dulcicalothrix desertica PCC 7102 TaxID=232991 RepID=A0A3S5K3F1_9CYAN|nr:hypothetical protein [Dulcicalothrix desertica]RUT07120.1 hypothetical protein DSM106972_023810 [Dulcicalothrix desertica PCC 7102]TWH61883.1 hypothetical protein CAL7102_00562 [Dulcicalothrix desertica PCC 7102]